MDYKRLEVYVGWTCNQKCNYCMEFPTMELKWKQKVTKISLLKKLISYKKKGYNHVTYLGGEPFIQPVFHDALLLGKKLGYTILVTTNATTLHIEKQAQKFLPYIDELILSVEAIDKETQQKISRTYVEVYWERVFKNIKKYWNGSLLKINIVIVQDNVDILYDMVVYLNSKGVKELSITYPDLDLKYYSKEHTVQNIAPKYSYCIKILETIVLYCTKNSIRLKIVDFPFCVFPEGKTDDWIKLTDDYDYESRVKVSDVVIGNTTVLDFERNRDYDNPRERYKIDKCSGCKYGDVCWGVAVDYVTLYGAKEIHSLIH